MPNLDIRKTLTVPATPAQEAAAAILAGIAEGKGDWEGFALHLDLRDVGLPDVGYVAVPIALSTPRVAPEGPFRAAFSLRALRAPEAFPTFEGELGIEPEEPSRSVASLQGSYELPLHKFGSIVDAVLGKGAARKTLENFLDDLCAAIVARVERRELAVARYRLMFSRG